jgi:hypothetical protein
MDYTTAAIVLKAIGGQETTDNDVINSAITAASRDIDRRVTGASGSIGANYFMLASVVNEQIWAQVDVEGHVLTWPHKAIVNSVSSFEYRRSPLDGWTAVDSDELVTIDTGPQLTAWVDARSIRSGRNIQARLSYNGGYSLTVNGLPEDLVEVATALAVRLYREKRTGMSDSLGVAELGTLTYTKALPVRVRDVIQQYQRIAPW